jgi:DNA-directed RNA polymerase specialized sigma24 family protein
LLLHAVHGFCYADIAATLGISEAAVKMRISRARAAFRQAYRSADEEEQP